MFHSAKAGLVAVALTASTLAITASPAEAAEGDTRPCVTKGEYRSVNPHMNGSGGTRARIHGIFDTIGTKTWGTSYMVNGAKMVVEKRRYRRCASTGKYTIEYHKYDGGRYVSYWG